MREDDLLESLDAASLSPGGLTRSQFIRRAAAAGVSLPTLGAALAACGSSGHPSSSGQTGASAYSAGSATTTPEAKGPIDTLTWGVLSEPVSLDWTQAYNDNYNMLTILVSESLLRLTPEFGFEPALAESWSHPDPLRWVFKIRQGVKFHDGSVMTPEDVAFSLSRNLSPNSFWAEWNTFMKSVEVSGPDEVTVHLKAPDELFIELMVTPLGGVGKASQVKSAGKAFGTPQALPIGTGPFKFTKWSTGQAVEYARHDAYWDKPAHAKTLSMQFVPDAISATNALLSGQIDGAYAYNLLDQLPRLRGSSSGKLYLGKSMRQALIFPTERPGPLQDPRVRLAWLMAIDRPAIAERLFHGGAVPFRNTVVPIDNWLGLGPTAVASAKTAYNKLLGPGPDLAMAKKLFQQAGAPKDEVILFATSTPLTTNAMEVCQAAGQSIGMNIRLASGTEGQELNLFYDATQRKKYHAFESFNYWSSVPDPTELLWEITRTPSTNGLSYSFVFRNPKNDALLTQARQTADKTQRANILLQAQALQASQVPVFPLVAQSNPLFMNNRITGAPASFCQLFYPWARDIGAA